MKLRDDAVIKKSFETVDKKGRKSLWEWEEGPELREFIRKQRNQPEATPPNRPQDNEVSELAKTQ